MNSSKGVCFGAAVGLSFPDGASAAAAPHIHSRTSVPPHDTGSPAPQTFQTLGVFIKEWMDSYQQRSDDKPRRPVSGLEMLPGNLSHQISQPATAVGKLDRTAINHLDGATD
jgi:hypothetical protein